MKKSKIIVPALGLLLLSTAASVSGTVAWFTANRTYDTSISNIAVVSTTGSLKGSFTSGCGTTASGTDNSAISVDSTAVLTHGSVNHSNKLASWPIDDSASKFASYTINGTKATDESTEGTTLYRLTDANGKNVYSAFVFTLTLTYTTSNVTDSYALFLDLGESKSRTTYVTNTAAATSGEGAGKSTYKGFRLAFIAPTAADTFVWAPNQTTANCHYNSAVNGSGVATVASTYTAGELIASDTTTIASLATDGGIVDGLTASAAQGYYNYMGTFAPNGTETSRSLSFICVAWFEGTDPNVITGAALDAVTAYMFFETRRLG